MSRCIPNTFFSATTTWFFGDKTDQGEDREQREIRRVAIDHAGGLGE